MEPLPGFHTPLIAGLALRHYQGEQDLPVMLDVFRSSRIPGKDLEHEDTLLESLEDITKKYRHLAYCDPYQDVLMAEVNGQMAAYGRVISRQLEVSGSAQGKRIYAMEWYIRPEWLGQGLEKIFLHLCQERIRQIIRLQDNQAPKGEAAIRGERLFEASATDLQPELARLLEEDGFWAASRGTMMTCFDLRNIPDAPMPSGMEVRPVKSEHYHQIWDALVDAFDDGKDLPPPTEDDFAYWQQSAQFQPDLWQIAWEGSQITGMVLNYVSHNPVVPSEPGIAWTEDICVRRPWRRRGLARALLARSMRMFREMGHTQTSLGVDLDNPQRAPRLYESMGYQVVCSITNYHKPADL